MRKPLVLLLAFVMIMALTACGANVTKTHAEAAPETTAPAKEKIFATIEAKNCFYDAGFVELIAGTREASEYTFTAENSDAVEWRVYILDQAFDDSLRYIKQITEPVLIGNGTIFIDEGQYVYVYCPANEFTTGVVNENAKLHITVK